MPKDNPANSPVTAKNSRLAEFSGDDLAKIFGDEDVLPQDERPEPSERLTKGRDEEFQANRPPHYE